MRRVLSLRKVLLMILTWLEVVVGKDDKHYVRIPTRLNEVYHWKSLAESLQRK